jgi:uncharacterized protein YndB with AHSA1/START domain
METKNYHSSVVMQAPAEEVYQALTLEMPKWWSADFSGSAKAKGDVFTVRFGNTFMTMEIEEVVTNERIIWRCIDTYQDHSTVQNNKTEWIGTRVIWEISNESNSTRLSITHEGLTPEFECYGICEQGWNFYLSSVYDLVTTGKGQPYEKSLR